MKTDGPAGDLQAALVTATHKFAKNVSALRDEVSDLRLERQALPARRGWMKIDCAILRKVGFASRAPRLKKAARMIGTRKTHAIETRAMPQFVERRVEPEIKNVPGIRPY